MGGWLGNTADGRGKQAVGKALTSGEQVGFADAAVFFPPVEQQRRFRGQGRGDRREGSRSPAARAKARGTPPDGLPPVSIG